MEGQKIKEVKLVEGAKKWEVERILNKRKVRGVVKYLVCSQQNMVVGKRKKT